MRFSKGNVTKIFEGYIRFVVESRESIELNFFIYPFMLNISLFACAMTSQLWTLSLSANILATLNDHRHTAHMTWTLRLL